MRLERGLQTAAVAVTLVRLASHDVEAQVSKPTAPPAAVVGGAEGYKVGLGDVLQVVVWKEPELIRDVSV